MESQALDRAKAAESLARQEQLPKDIEKSRTLSGRVGPNHERFQGLVRDQLRYMTPEPERGMGIDETPRRVSRMWLEELTAGYEVSIEGLFRLFPTEDYSGLVLVKDIPVRSVCVHHLVPFVGYAHIGYVPDEKVIGLSKLPRLVDAFSRRLQIQENITNQVIDALEKYLKPKGAIVMISAEHMCMTLRGVQAPGTMTLTSAACGTLEAGEEREEFFKMLNGGHR